MGRMPAPPPLWRVPSIPGGGFPAEALRPALCQGIAPLPPFVPSHGRGLALQPTRVRLAWSGASLHVLFECEDRDAWGTFTRRDEPLYQEEVVEVFLAPGSETPAAYFEIEVSPLGTVFDARIENPRSRRSDMVTDPSWDCPGLAWAVGRGEARQDWWAALSIPWASVGVEPGRDLPRSWRANFYRIERPRDGSPEFSAWSPTLVEPADFHKPERFGLLELEAPSEGAVRR